MQFYVSSILLIYAWYVLKHFHVVLSSDGQYSYMHTFESIVAMLSRVIFYQFFVQYSKIGVYTGIYNFLFFALKL